MVGFSNSQGRQNARIAISVHRTYFNNIMSCVNPTLQSGCYVFPDRTPAQSLLKNITASRTFFRVAKIVRLMSKIGMQTYFFCPRTSLFLDQNSRILSEFSNFEKNSFFKTVVWTKLRRQVRQLTDLSGVCEKSQCLKKKI